MSKFRSLSSPDLYLQLVGSVSTIYIIDMIWQRYDVTSLCQTNRAQLVAGMPNSFGSRQDETPPPHHISIYWRLDIFGF